MNMYLFELKANRKFALGWLITIVGIMLIYTSFYPVFHKDMASFISMINNMPEAIRTAMGFNPETIGSILGYYTFVFIFVLVFGAVEAMILGLSILSKEIRERTADFLLSKPVSRIKIVTTKLLTSLTIILVSNIIYFVSFYLILLAFTNTSFDFKTYSLITLILLFMQLIFFSLGILISVIIPKIKAVITIALGIVFCFYFLGTFTTDNLRILMPFKYFDLPTILLKTQYELKYIYITFGVILISIILTYLIYKKKDIPTV